MKTALARINRTPTSTYLILWVAIFVAACLLDALGGYLWVSHRVHTPKVETLSTILGWIGISGLFIFPLVTAFRPFNEFSLKGHCRQRAKLFGITIGINLVFFACLFWMVWKAF